MIPYFYTNDSHHKSTSGTLYVIATPIGNLADISARAIDLLRHASLIAAEDTRHSQRLLNRYNIQSRCIPYHEHSEEKTAQTVIKVLQNGKDVALISDAGTPLISDPGYRLVQAVQAQQIPVSPVPGPSALAAALSVSGLPTDAFLFLGFLPSKSAARTERLERYQNAPHTLVFYEAPHRLLACLEDMATVFGVQRVAVIARELTKQYETVVRDQLGALVEKVRVDHNQQRGECVVLVSGKVAESVSEAELNRVLLPLLDELPLKQAVALAARITGEKKNAVYSAALAIKAG